MKRDAQYSPGLNMTRMYANIDLFDMTERALKVLAGSMLPCHNAGLPFRDGGSCSAWNSSRRCPTSAAVGYGTTAAKTTPELEKY